jgi:regulator of protease activity HflC (stomatin/prohibitin superfamily)
MNKFAIGAIITGSVIVGGIVASAMSLTQVDPGYAGVVYSPNGGIKQETLTQGWHFVAPFNSVTEYPVSTETVYLTKAGTEENPVDESFNISTKEGKPVNVDAMYSYHMLQEKLPHIFTKFRRADTKTIESGYIKTNLKAAIQEVTSQYSVLDIYGEKRDEITQKVMKEFADRMKPDGIVIETFSFGEIRPDEASMRAIQAKVDAQQKLQQYETEKKQAEVLADKARIEAKGKADAQLIEAEGRAKANAKLQQSITPELIEYEKAKRWDGKLPQVQGNAGVMMQMQPSQQ